MPGRPCVRPFAAFLFVVAFILLLWGTTVAVRYVGAEAHPSPDLSNRFEELAARLQPEGADAWPVYEPALRALADEPCVQTTTIETAPHIGWLLEGSLDDPRLGPIRRKYDRRRSLLHVLDEASERPACRWPAPAIPTDAITLGDALGNRVDVDMHRALRELVTVNAAGMRIAAGRGEWDEVRQRLRAGLTLCRHYSFRPAITDALVAESARSMMIHEAARMALEHNAPEAACLTMIEAVRRIRLAPFQYALEGERLFEHCWLEWTHAPQRQGGAALLHMSAKPTLWDRVKNLGAIRLPDREDSAAEIDRVYDALIAWASLPPGRRGEPPMPAKADMAAANVANPALIAIFAGNGVGATGRVYVPTQVTLIASAARRDAANLGCVLALRLAAYRDATGAWPEALGDAAPPEETVDPETGEPYRYSVESIGDAPLTLPVRLWRWNKATASEQDFVRPRGGLDELAPSVFEAWREADTDDSRMD